MNGLFYFVHREVFHNHTIEFVAKEKRDSMMFSERCYCIIDASGYGIGGTIVESVVYLQLLHKNSRVECPFFCKRISIYINTSYITKTGKQNTNKNNKAQAEALHSWFVIYICELSFEPFVPLDKSVKNRRGPRE